jgi:hypothetical protein
MTAKIITTYSSLKLSNNIGSSASSSHSKQQQQQQQQQTSSGLLQCATWMKEMNH